MDNRFYMPMSLSELKLTKIVLESQIKWAEGGCFGDGEKVDDKVGFADAKKLLKRINAKISQVNK
jgi:hypothetical protein